MHHLTSNILIKSYWFSEGILAVRWDSKVCSQVSIFSIYYETNNCKKVNYNWSFSSPLQGCNLWLTFDNINILMILFINKTVNV